MRGEEGLPVGGIKQAELRDFVDWESNRNAGDWEAERFRKTLFSHVWAERVGISMAAVNAWTDHASGQPARQRARFTGRRRPARRGRTNSGLDDGQPVDSQG